MRMVRSVVFYYRFVNFERCFPTSPGASIQRRKKNQFTFEIGLATKRIPNAIHNHKNQIVCVLET